MYHNPSQSTKQGQALSLPLIAILLVTSFGSANCGLFSHITDSIKGAVGRVPPLVVNTSPGIRNGDNVVKTNSTNQGGQPQIHDPRSSNKNDSDDYASMCLLKRSAQWKYNPSLFFFAASNHSSDSLNCQGGQKIELNISASIDDDDDYYYHYNSESDSDEPWQTLGLVNDEEDVKRLLMEFYDGSLDTYFIIHGFMASWDGNIWMCRLKDMILNNTNANVFVVDWSGGAKPMLPIDYSQAVANTQYVAKLVGDCIKWLMKISNQADASRFHLIGHSLGAHISGFIGYSLNGLLGRITALDPAGPCFSEMIPKISQDIGQLLAGETHDSNQTAATSRLQPKIKRRLSASSAKLVIALHTDTSLFGLNENAAHFNVYVNGGYKQPNCASSNLQGRLIDLLQLDLANVFSTDITCAHSYAHQIVDTFAELANELTNFSDANAATTRESSLKNYSHRRSKGLDEGSSEEIGYVLDEADRCYPMAYRCNSYEAFLLGECGYCAADDDTRCVFTGLYLGDQRSDPEGMKVARERTDSFDDVNDNSGNKYALRNKPTRDTNNNDDFDDHVIYPNDNDDDKFNDEDDQEPPYYPTEEVSRGHHFIKTAAKMPTCLYHYQVIIAANATQSSQSSWLDELMESGKRKHFYLQIPLNQGRGSGAVLVDSDGSRKRDRLVQVSHYLKSGSSAHAKLSGDPLIALRREYSSSSDKLGSISAKQLVFYTALITFKSAPRERESGRCNEEAFSNDTGAWYLCGPLSELEEARIWSSNKKQLAQIQWVALNYMSGIKLKSRLRASHLFVTDTEQGIQSANEMDASLRPSIGELSSAGKATTTTTTTTSGYTSVGRTFSRLKDETKKFMSDPTASASSLLSSALKSLDCLVSTMNPLESGGSKNNMKCDRGKSELKYSAKLRPIKANSKSKFST